MVGTQFPFTFPATFGDGDETPPVTPPFTLPGDTPVTFGSLTKPSTYIVDPWQQVSIHTASGVQLHQFLPDQHESLLWTRNLRETSRSELVAPTSPDTNLREIMPWRDWISVFDSAGRDLYWTGPIVHAEGDHDRVTINALDVSAFGKATNLPITKRYEATDPADIAAELYSHIARQHGLRIRPVVRRDPEGDPFDFDRVKQDEKNVTSVMEELARLGLYWSVVSGVPVFGPASARAITDLGEADFVEGGLRWVRDGRESFNEVLVRGADNLAYAAVEMGGLHLQKIVDIENMFGVPNVQRAADQHVRQTGFIRDVITVPGGAKLHPDAPVDIEHLIPSTRYRVEAFGMRHLVELEGLEVRTVAGDVSVGVNLESVRTPTDLEKAATSGGES